MHNDLPFITSSFAIDLFFGIQLYSSSWVDWLATSVLCGVYRLTSLLPQWLVFL